MQRKALIASQPEFTQAFVANERQERIWSGKVACALVMALMPAGVVLDWFVYPEHLPEFLRLRMLCSGAGLALWYLHKSSFGQRHYRWLGIPVAILPALFISWMIFATEGPESPYYAGLILILLAVNAIVHWSIGESLIATAIVFFLYLAACLPWNISRESGTFFNNIYFLVLTGVIVVTGNYLYNELHFREFALRFELHQNREKLEKANQRLVELDRVKSQFFANISHELRTPLTLLLAPLQTVIQEHGSALQPDMRQLVFIMQSNGMRLLKLINDLLDLVRLESGTMEIKKNPVVIEPFLRGLVSAIQATADDRAIIIEVSSDETIGAVLTDDDKLERILLNLLFNALKFTPAGGKIKLTAACEDNHLVLQVSDTGAGISKEQLPFIFDRFWQADTSSQRKYGGMGIGLAIVKELVEIQGGSVGVTSEVGNGTRFTVRLPYEAVQGKQPSPSESLEFAATAEISPAATRPEQGTHAWLKALNRQAELHPPMTSLRDTIRTVESSIQSGQPRVLIADDEPDMLKYLKSELSNGFHILEAVDGAQAVEKAQQFLPDVIVCDMMMPEKDGLQVCRELRELTSTRSIPILLLTARADEETKLAALSAGANDFITKPFSMTELRVRIKNLVDAHDLQQKLSRQNQILEATIEQLKDTEVQLVHSEKLASLGRMSAGLIHEINNPLNFAKTGLYVLGKMIEASGADKQAEFREVLRDLQEGMDRISSIISDLRTFTQPNLTEMQSVSVADVVNSALRLLSSEWYGKARIEKEFREDQTIWANRNQVTQVLVNLLQNALHALTKKHGSAGAATIWVRAAEQDGESLLIVRDNGEGISSEHLYKIFDPFFTTKDVGEGMGLGLSICYRIMKQHGGRIHVRSEPGAFCEFTLYFPHRPTSSMAA
jgi:signal transduction histidine kinase